MLMSVTAVGKRDSVAAMALLVQYCCTCCHGRVRTPRKMIYHLYTDVICCFFFAFCRKAAPSAPV